MGTVPFLGTFLKDLEYIHAQNPTKNEKGLINVMQKRKEFEIVAQIIWDEIMMMWFFWKRWKIVHYLHVEKEGGI